MIDINFEEEMCRELADLLYDSLVKTGQIPVFEDEEIDIAARKCYADLLVLQYNAVSRMINERNQAERDNALKAAELEKELGIEPKNDDSLPEEGQMRLF